MLRRVDLWRAAVLVWLCVGLVLLCSACGGSNCPQDDARCHTPDTQPVDCKTNPARCI